MIRRLLVCGDVHENVGKVTEVAEWVAKHHICVDAVLCDGDMGNMSLADHSLPGRVAECEAHMSTVLSALENISVNVYYVPGNHCSPTAFMEEKKSDPPQLTPHSHNVHCRACRIADGIVVAGIGGSTPASQGDKEVFWSAFPFGNGGDEALALAIKKLEVDCGDIYDEEKDALLLLCHQGPSLSCTTIDFVVQPCIHSGSRALSSFVLANQNRLALLVHGHTHNAVGCCNVGRVPVLNPGCLRDGRFAMVTLARPPNKKHYAVASCELVDLMA